MRDQEPRDFWRLFSALAATAGDVQAIVALGRPSLRFADVPPRLVAIRAALHGLVPYFINMTTYFRAGFLTVPGTLGGGGTIAYAQGEPVSDRADPCGARGTRSTSAAVYVTVSRRRPRETGFARCPGRVQ